MEGVWATIFICHFIFGGHLLNIPKSNMTSTYKLKNLKTKESHFIFFSPYAVRADSDVAPVGASTAPVAYVAPLPSVS